MSLTKTQRENAIARNQASAARRKQRRDNPVEFDWDDAIARLKNMFDEFDERERNR
jgi:hypothetical protein